MKTGLLEAGVAFVEQPFLKPLQISSGLITQATEARVSVRVRVGSREATGRGSIYLSDLWAWPGVSPDRAAKDAAMRRLCERLVASLGDACGGEAEHPLELGLRLHHTISAPDLCPEMPLLARAVCASPFDAAIHDAAGQALGVSAFRFYDEPAAIPSADAWFPGESACGAIRRALRPPVSSLDAWWVVSARDDLETAVRPAVERGGIRCFKIKVLAKDNAADAARTAEVFRAARSWGIASPVLSVDSNEGNPDAAAVLDYLDRLEALDPEAYSALDYLEQPTARDIAAHPFDWRAAGERKPVFLDEGLTGLELLPVAKQQGWNGFALKTCKGHSFTLVSAAWALANGMELSLQDLTNPGFSAIHAFLVGAHLPTRNGVELNSPQYTPAANAPWLPRLAGLFAVRDGRHRMEGAGEIRGLGSEL
ncbi:hypothetical protein OPIT5_24775 [Opitutaceae bacterium TAV5]|nr:hypothetical protein OPIT5_24775 [Opitutaceae bacterium TAV5]